MKNSKTLFMAILLIIARIITLTASEWAPGQMIIWLNEEVHGR